MNKQPSFGFGGENGLRKEPAKKDEEEDEWGLGSSKPSAGGNGGRLLGRKSKKEDDDDLDNFLDDIEAKRGLESTKQPSPRVIT